MIEIEMRMFGGFRKFDSEQKPIILQVENPSTVEQIRNALSKRMGDQFSGLIHDSAIADEVGILSSESILTHSCTLSILPPVCGG